MKKIIVKRMRHTATNQLIYQPVLTMINETGTPCFTPQKGMKLGMIVHNDDEDNSSFLSMIEGSDILPITDKTYEKLYELMDVLQVQLAKTEISIKPNTETLVNTYKNIENQLNTMLPFGHSHKEMDVDEIVKLIVCEHVQGKQTEVCLDEHENICAIDTSLLEEDLMEDEEYDEDEDYDDYDEDEELLDEEAEDYDDIPDAKDLAEAFDFMRKMFELSQKRQ